MVTDKLKQFPKKERKNLKKTEQDDYIYNNSIQPVLIPSNFY